MPKSAPFRQQVLVESKRIIKLMRLNMTEFSRMIENAKQHIQSHYSQPIDTAIILGSGLGHCQPDLKNRLRLEYQTIPGLTAPSVPSHDGHLTIGNINQQSVAICQGRHHLYEGYTAQQVAMMVYVLHSLGTKKLIITNATGALNPDFQPGDVMAIQDHINFTGHNPIIGQDKKITNQFVDMSQAYNASLLTKAQQAAAEHGVNFHQGVYAGVLGPSLETSAERKMLSTLGADAVGMSTVIEVIAANHCGMQVLGLSAITNMATGDENQQVDTIEDVLKNAAIAGQEIIKIINAVLE